MLVAVGLKLAVLYGVVTIGPVTPVCRADVPCDKPGVHVRLTFLRRGRTFVTTSDGGGRFRIRLAPGIYAVRAGVGMSMQPRTVDVHAPATRLDVSIDTGIR